MQCFLAEPTVTTEKPRAVHTKSVRSHVAGTDHKAGQGKSGITALCSLKRGVAQLGSAGALGALGRRFESCRPDCRYCKGFRGFPEPLFFVLQRKMHAKRVDDLLEPLRAGALRQAATGSEPLGGRAPIRVLPAMARGRSTAARPPWPRTSQRKRTTTPA